MDTMITNGNGDPIKTLMQAMNHFADLDVAHATFAKLRWPNGPICPHCESKDVTYSPKYRRFECKHRHDRRQFTVKTGTIMEDSPLSLDKWAVAFWLEVNAKNSISSYEIHRALGITQKSAWFMLHRIRLAVHTGSFDKKLSGVVEADETMVGGLAANMHKKVRDRKVGNTRGGAHMTNVMGLLNRHDGNKHSTVRTAVVADRKKESLLTVIHKNVEPGTTLYTDALKNYRDVSIAGTFNHDFVDHAEAYVKDKVVHTNGLENFWALFKRCIKGTHVSVEPFHLAAYVDSEAFRFNNREMHDGQRFVSAVKGMSGKRLMYKDLIGALEGAPGTASDASGAGNKTLPN
jgi:transposase-like protein